MNKFRQSMSNLLIAALLIANTSVAQSMSQPLTEKNIISADDTSSIIIKGKVVDSKGDPIGFASIRAGKKGNIIFANEKGEFEMSVPRSAILVVGSAGYDDKEVTLGSTEGLRIQLEQAADMGNIDVSSSQVIGNGNFSDDKQARRMDSLYANDEVIQRDLQLPANMNKISIYPSSIVSGGNITLGVQLLEQGKYEWQLVNASGKIVYQKDLAIEKNTKIINLAVPELAAGAYQFVLIQKNNGKKIIENITIQ